MNESDGGRLTETGRITIRFPPRRSGPRRPSARRPRQCALIAKSASRPLVSLPPRRRRYHLLQLTVALLPAGLSFGSQSLDLHRRRRRPRTPVCFKLPKRAEDANGGPTRVSCGTGSSFRGLEQSQRALVACSSCYLKKFIKQHQLIAYDAKRAV